VQKYFISFCVSLYRCTPTEVGYISLSRYSR